MSLLGSPWFDPGLPPPTYQQIMELVDGPSHPDTDSRTAAVNLKRHRGDESQRGSSRGSSKQSTPRKRMKYSASLGRQDIADFVPNGASFSASNLATDTDHEAGDGKLDDAAKSATELPSNLLMPTEGSLKKGKLRSPDIRLEVPVAQRPDQIPSVGAIAPGLMHKFNSIAVKENSAYVQAFEKAFATCRTLQDAATKARTKGKERAIIQCEEDLHRAEINLAWCKHYPLNYDWFLPKAPPLPRSTSHKGLNECQKFWLIVEICFAKGTLLDLRAGKFGGCTHAPSASHWQAMANRQDVQAARDRYDLCAQRIKHADSTSSTEPLHKQLALAEVDMMYCIFYPRSRTYEPLDGWRHYGSDIVNTKPSLHGSAAHLWSLVRHCMGTKRLSELKEGRLGEFDDDGDIRRASTESGPCVEPKDVEEPQGNRKPISQVNSEGSDDEDCIHDADDRHAGPINYSERDRSDAEVFDPGDDNTRMSISSNSDLIVTNIGAEDEEYSQSDSLQAVEEGRNNRDDSDAEMETMDTYRHSAQGTGRDSVTATIQKARTLAELSPDDLKTQIRYFHIPKGANDVSRSSLVRCLTCGAKGHMAADCEMLDCTSCGAFNDHITADCPLNVKCPKCRTPGHRDEACFSKLMIPRDDIICDHCNCRGHVEEDCELFWRTSGAPWKSKLPLGQIRISCYECGLMGHLGNECPTRQPRKSMGSSSWSIHQHGPTTTTFGNSELKPPKRATKTPKILGFKQSNQDDETDQLVLPSNQQARAKTPAAGKIRINIAHPPNPSATNAAAVNALVNEKFRKGPNEATKTSSQPIEPPTQPPMRWQDIPQMLGAGPQMGQWGVINTYPGAGTHSPTLSEASHTATAETSTRHQTTLSVRRRPPPPLPAAVQAYQQGHQYNHSQQYGWPQG